MPVDGSRAVHLPSYHRCTHATHLLPAHIVSARLGHASPVTTMRVYAHVLPKSDDQAAELVGVLLAG